MKKIFTCVLLLILSFQLGFNNTYTAQAISNSSISTSQSNSDILLAKATPTPTKKSTKATPTPTVKVDNTVPTSIDSIQNYLISEGIALVDATTGRVLYEKNGDERLFPASTTKIMTAILAIENVSLDSVVTVGTEATSVPADSSLMNPRLTVGEKITVKDLLYAMMFSSSNDAAETLAVFVGGTRENFINMMNEKAKELGMDNTNFVNPHGYQDVNHYSTALDLAKLACYASKNSTFIGITSSTSYTIAATNKNKARALTNSNKLLNQSAAEYLSSATGMKTGTTTEAQDCLVSAATSGSKSIVCVTLKHSVTSTTNRFVESKKLLLYGLYALDTPASADTLYILATPTPTPTDIVSEIDSSATPIISDGSNVLTTIGNIIKIVLIVLAIIIILFIIYIIFKKRQRRRRKYKSQYLYNKARR